MCRHTCCFRFSTPKWFESKTNKTYWCLLPSFWPYMTASNLANDLNKASPTRSVCTLHKLEGGTSKLPGFRNAPVADFCDDSKTAVFFWGGQSLVVLNWKDACVWDNRLPRSFFFWMGGGRYTIHLQNWYLANQPTTSLWWLLADRHFWYEGHLRAWLGWSLWPVKLESEVLNWKLLKWSSLEFPICDFQMRTHIFSTIGKGTSTFSNSPWIYSHLAKAPWRKAGLAARCVWMDVMFFFPTHLSV